MSSWNRRKRRDRAAGKEAAALAPRGVGRARRRSTGGGAARRDKTALVLGGGGFTGGVYEIGALRALDLLAVNRTVNQFDVYVGTSRRARSSRRCAPTA